MDEQRADPHVTTATNTIEELHRYLADQPSMEQLYRILCSYVSKFAMVPPQEVENEAYELLPNQQVVLLGDIHMKTHPALSEEEFFDVFTAQLAEERAQIANLHEDLKDALACLSEEDQTILNFYIHYGFNHNEIARMLQIKPGAARTRCCRALDRLYKIWISQDENRRGENNA